MLLLPQELCLQLYHTTSFHESSHQLHLPTGKSEATWAMALVTGLMVASFASLPIGSSLGLKKSRSRWKWELGLEFKEAPLPSYPSPLPVLGKVCSELTVASVPAITIWAPSLTAGWSTGWCILVTSVEKHWGWSLGCGVWQWKCQGTVPCTAGFLLLLFLTGGQLLYDVVLVSAILWCESVICIHICPLPLEPPCHLTHPSRLSQSTAVGM